MEIERHLKILDPELQEKLWNFYHDIFKELNKRTPLAQTLDKPRFRSWLESSRAVKFIVQSEGEIKAFAIVSRDLRHDPLISREYWQGQFPGKRLFHFPAIAITPEFRREYRKLCTTLIDSVVGETGPDGIGLFFHSELANPAMPRLIERSSTAKVSVRKIDSMACVLCERSKR